MTLLDGSKFMEKSWESVPRKSLKKEKREISPEKVMPSVGNFDRSDVKLKSTFFEPSVFSELRYSVRHYFRKGNANTLLPTHQKMK